MTPTAQTLQARRRRAVLRRLRLCPVCHRPAVRLDRGPGALAVACPCGQAADAAAPPLVPRQGAPWR